MKKSMKRSLFVILALILCLSMCNLTAFAYDSYTSKITLYAGDGKPTGTVMKVGDTWDGGWKVTAVNTSSVTFAQKGQHNNSFKIPAPEAIWTGVSSNYKTVVTGSSFTSTSELRIGQQALVLYTGGKGTYKNVVNTGGSGSGGDQGGGSESYLWNFELKFDANGGNGAPKTLTWGTNDKYTKSHTFTIPDTIPTRDGYTFRGWADTKNATEATRQPGNDCLVSATSIPGYNGGSVSKTLYAVWQLNEIEPSEPESSNTSEPESSNTSEPESSNTSEPESSNTSEPESSNTSEPESSNTSEPESSNTSEPESSNTSEPESSNTSEPESSNTSEPESSNTSEPESSNTSEISGDPSGDNSDESSNTGDDSNTGDNESSNAGDNSGAGDNSNAGDSSDSGKNPQTGENSFTLMIALLFLCGSAVVGTAVVSRKQKAN